MRARAGVLHAPFGVYVVDMHEFFSIFRYQYPNPFKIRPCCAVFGASFVVDITYKKPAALWAFAISTSTMTANAPGSMLARARVFARRAPGVCFVWQRALFSVGYSSLVVCASGAFVALFSALSRVSCVFSSWFFHVLSYANSKRSENRRRRTPPDGTIAPRFVTPVRRQCWCELWAREPPPGQQVDSNADRADGGFALILAQLQFWHYCGRRIDPGRRNWN